MPQNIMYGHTDSFVVITTQFEFLGELRPRGQRWKGLTDRLKIHCGWGSRRFTFWSKLCSTFSNTNSNGEAHLISYFLYQCILNIGFAFSKTNTINSQCSHMSRSHIVYSHLKWQRSSEIVIKPLVKNDSIAVSFWGC